MLSGIQRNREDVVPLSIDEIIKKVRIEKEFGEIREMTEIEKTNYDID
jgi:hypothetical protein